jgi:MIP family channel proteins
MKTKPFLAELVGTFTLVFIGAGTGALASANGGGIVAVALAHGIALMVIIYAWGSVSGAHVNPAVTFALALTGKTSWGDAIQYWIAQLMGAGAAGFALLFALGDSAGTLGMTLPAGGISDIQAIFIEAILTFFLVVAVFGSAVAGRNGNAVGLAIGFVLAMDILMGGALTGASMNPARSFGPALAQLDFQSFWVYIVGPLLGGTAAALFYDRVFLKEG